MTLKKTKAAFTRNGKIICIVTLLFCLVFCACGTAFCQSRDEYAVKAAFIVNFAKFSQWPKETFTNSNQPLTLCVAKGKNLTSFFKNIEEKKIYDRTLKIRYINDKEEVDGCHILFASKEVKEAALNDFIATVKGKPVLTIGETENFAKAGGGVINLIVKDKKLRFEINMKTADQQKIKLSSQLLKLAILVNNSK